MTRKETVELKEYFDKEIQHLQDDHRACEARMCKSLKELENHLNDKFKSQDKMVELALAAEVLKQREFRENRQENTGMWRWILAAAIPTVIALILKFAI
jgi:hypothetical protein